MGDIDVSVVVVNWNGREQIGHCLGSLPAAAPGCRLETIVVDNASSDDSVGYLSREYPEVTIIESDTNLGYARGAQLGIELARGEFVAVANPDLVLAPEALCRLVRTLRDRPKAAWVGPKIVRTDGRIQSGPFPLCSLLEPLATFPLSNRSSRFVRSFRHDRVQKCERLSGAFMLFRTALLRAMGGMPDSTFLFGEEILLGAKCRDKGYEVWYDPSAVVFHEHGASVNQLWDEEERRLATQAGHLAALRSAVSYPRFFAYCVVSVAVLTSRLVLALLGRPFPLRLTSRLAALSLRALFGKPGEIARER